jgi:hypothetical protein
MKGIDRKLCLLSYLLFISITAMVWGQVPSFPDRYESGREEWVLVRYPTEGGRCLESGADPTTQPPPQTIEVLICSTPAFCEFVRQSLRERAVFPDLGLEVVALRFLGDRHSLHLFVKAPPGARPIQVPLKLSLKPEVVSTLIAEVQPRLRDRSSPIYALIRIALDMTGRPGVVEFIYVDDSLVPYREAIGDGLRVDWRGRPPQPLVLFILLSVSAYRIFPLDWVGYALSSPEAFPGPAKDGAYR